jgi:L-fucose dehydrogenase
VKVLAAEVLFPLLSAEETDNMKVVSAVEKSGGMAFQVELINRSFRVGKSSSGGVKKFGRIEGLINNAGVNDGEVWKMGLRKIYGLSS